MRAKKSNKSQSKIALIIIAVLILLVFLGFGDNEAIPIPKEIKELVSEIKSIFGISDSKPSTGDFSFVDGELSVHLIDVGQGETTLIITPLGETILVDGGDAKNEVADKIISYIKDLGITKLDIVIATHPHADHIGSLDDAILEFRPDYIYMPDVSHTTRAFSNLLDAIETANVKVIEAKAGVRLETIKGVNAFLVAPVREYGNNLNEWSAVLRIEYKDTSFMLMGDAEAVNERDIMASGTNVKTDVLFIGHHGSTTSSTRDFIEAVSPTIGVIHVGEGNSYGHPHREVLELLAEFNVRLYRTDLNGDIVLTSDGNRINVKTSKP